MQIANLKQLFGLQKQKMTMCIITSKSNSSFGTIAKATGVKMTAKAVGLLRILCPGHKNVPDFVQTHFVSATNV